MNTAFLVLRTAHIVSAALIFGTGLGIAFFTWFGYRAALRSGDIGALRNIMRLTVTADTWITAPAVTFQALSGIGLMLAYGWPMVSAWSVTVWALFVLAGVCWLPILRLQVLLRREAEAAASVAALPERFHAWFRWWFWLALPAFGSVIAIYWMMVAKPLSIA